MSAEEVADGYIEVGLLRPRVCRVCGCTDDDCSQCIAATGEPCHWVEWDLCSRCAAVMDKVDAVDAVDKSSIANSKGQGI